MKKYLLLIPTMFVMLLNVIGCGQVVFNASAAVDYSEYFLPTDSIAYPSGLAFEFDVTNADDFRLFVTNSDPYNSNPFICNCPDYYFYCVYMSLYDYEKYSSGQDAYVSFCYYGFESCDYQYNDYNIFFPDTQYGGNSHSHSRRVLYRSDGTFDFSSSCSSSRDYLNYCKTNGQTTSRWYTADNIFSSELPCNNYYFYQATNIPDFPFPDFVDYSGGSSSNKLNVDVSFDPLLSGTVDRNVSGSLVSSFNMNITNNSNSPIQYRMAIFEGNVSSFDSCFSPYSNSNCIFTYMSYDWIYCKDVSKMRSLTATSNLLLQNVGTSWHYLDRKSSFSQTFNYSQINFSKNKTYSVVVEAGLINLDYPSGYFVDNIASLNRVENLDKENLKYILDYSTFSTVFSSTFTFDSLKGISYDSSDNSFGIIANSSDDDYTYAINDRQAFYDKNGNFDFTSYNPIDDEDSYIYNSPIKSPDEWKDENNILYDDSSGFSSIYSSVAFSTGDFSFGNGFSNFGSMLGSVFNIFPTNFWKMFTAGFISIIVIAIVKAVK